MGEFVRAGALISTQARHTHTHTFAKQANRLVEYDAMFDVVGRPTACQRVLACGQLFCGFAGVFEIGVIASRRRRHRSGIYGRTIECRIARLYYL